ncbi:hypothetical protein N7456_010950 [Penicillium angulare]|uniref:Uncharacterized protein n=1 Tax=Penicillium angulare TaxID=116970 RepID=A0A9W9ET03_9EURO|nr:hypothetical protein N7456_010950 [Penicillium angulare]
MDAQGIIDEFDDEDDFGNQDEGASTSEELLLRGTEIHNWLVNRMAPSCPVRRPGLLRLTLRRIRQISSICWQVPVDEDDERFVISGMMVGYIRDGPRTDWYVHFRGRPAGHVMIVNLPGIICIENIRRIEDSPEPYISETIYALYRESPRPRSALRHIVYCAIFDANTYAFVAGFGNGVHRWRVDSPFFHRALGTRLGRIAGYIVLVAFPRATHTIQEIHLERNFAIHANYIRFEIAPIQQNSH